MLQKSLQRPEINILEGHEHLGEVELHLSYKSQSSQFAAVCHPPPREFARVDLANKTPIMQVESKRVLISGVSLKVPEIHISLRKSIILFGRILKKRIDVERSFEDGSVGEQGILV